MKSLHLYLIIVFLSVALVADDFALIIQPNAPGIDSRVLNAEEAIQIADTSFTLDDVVFLEQMIIHHQQA